MARKVSDRRPVASSHGSSVYHHGARLVAIVVVALLCCYAVTWGMCYVRMAHLERDVNNALSERMMVGEVESTMKSQLVLCPAAEVTLEDIPADASQSTGHHMAIELWVMIKQNNRIEAEISAETMVTQREADNAVHILDALRASGCSVRFGGSVGSSLDSSMINETQVGKMENPAIAVPTYDTRDARER